MKKYLIAVNLFISIIGIKAFILLDDFLFAICFLWVLVKSFIDLSDKS